MGVGECFCVCKRIGIKFYQFLIDTFYYGIYNAVCYFILELTMSDFDFNAALKAHAEWKTKLRDAIANKETLDEHKIAKDDVCPLGAWLHDKDTTNNFAHLSNYRECKKMHTNFHKEAAKIAKEINNKNYDKAQQMLATGSEYSSISTDIALCIHQLKQDVQS